MHILGLQKLGDLVYCISYIGHGAEDERAHNNVEGAGNVRMLEQILVERAREHSVLGGLPKLELGLGLQACLHCSIGLDRHDTE